MKRLTLIFLIAVVVMPQCKSGEIPFAYTDSEGKATTGCVPAVTYTKDK